MLPSRQSVKHEKSGLRKVSNNLGFYHAASHRHDFFRLPRVRVMNACILENTEPEVEVEQARSSRKLFSSFLPSRNPAEG